MKERRMLVPDYMQQFHCIGSACEDSCCTGWLVSIDQASYKKYGHVKDQELKTLMKENITRNKSHRTNDNYAAIKMLPNHECVFLSAEKMCKIQLKYGEDYLSNTCATYPRTINVVDAVAEKSATMSCPEAARLALLNPAGIKFIEIKEPAEVRYSPRTTLYTENLPFMNKAQKYFWDIRTFVIQLLQFRDVQLADRLILLGSFCQKLQELIDNRTIDAIPDLFSYYTHWLGDDQSRESVSNIPTNYLIQMLMIKEVIDERLVRGVNNQRYIECVKETLHGLHYIQGVTYEELLHQYIVSYTQYYLPFMEQHEYILENYLVNYVFKNLFPFRGSLSVFDEYVMLVVHYSLIKMHLIGLAGYHQGLTQEIAVKLIQSFAKTVEHNSQYLEFVIDLLKKNDVTNLAYMAILIKN